jgi:hypothetical protein
MMTDYSGELSSYTPSFRERVVDFLAKNWYGDTREGVESAKKLVGVSELLPPVSAATYGYDSGRSLAQGRYGDAALESLGSGAGIAALGMAKRGPAMVEKMAPRASIPKSENYVVVSPGAFKTGPLSDRMPNSPSDITYGYRSMSAKELNDAIDSGFLRPNPKGSKHGKGSNEKWFSGGDESGQFGRTWKGGDSAPVRVRIQRGKIPEKGAVRSDDLEILDPQTGEFVPLIKIMSLQRKAKKAD